MNQTKDGVSERVHAIFGTTQLRHSCSRIDIVWQSDGDATDNVPFRVWIVQRYSHPLSGYGESYPLLAVATDGFNRPLGIQPVAPSGALWGCAEECSGDPLVLKVSVLDRWRGLSTRVMLVDKQGRVSSAEVDVGRSRTGSAWPTGSSTTP